MRISFANEQNVIVDTGLSLSGSVPFVLRRKASFHLF